jgi:hypothetical protein
MESVSVANARYHLLIHAYGLAKGANIKKIWPMNKDQQWYIDARAISVWYPCGLTQTPPPYMKLELWSDLRSRDTFLPWFFQSHTAHFVCDTSTEMHGSNKELLKRGFHEYYALAHGLPQKKDTPLPIFVAFALDCVLRDQIAKPCDRLQTSEALVLPNIDRIRHMHIPTCKCETSILLELIRKAYNIAQQFENVIKEADNEVERPLAIVANICILLRHSEKDPLYPLFAAFDAHVYLTAKIRDSVNGGKYTYMYGKACEYTRLLYGGQEEVLDPHIKKALLSSKEFRRLVDLAVPGMRATEQWRTHMLNVAKEWFEAERPTEENLMWSDT